MSEHRAKQPAEQESTLRPRAESEIAPRSDVPRRLGSAALGGLPQRLWEAGNTAISKLLGRGHSGQPIEPQTRTGMEQSYGADFGAVRLHGDPAAQEAAAALGAEAFTHGADIYLSADAPAPESPDGKKLLAHELAHVVQQRQAGAIESERVSQPGDEFEQNADQAAAAASAGQSAWVQPMSAPPTLQRQEDPRKKPKKQPAKPLPPVIEGAVEKGVGVGSEGVSVGGVPGKVVGKAVKGDFKGAIDAAQDPSARKKDSKAEFKKETQKLREGLDEWKPREKGPFIRPPTAPPLRVLERLERNELSPLEKVQRLERRIRRLPDIFKARQDARDLEKDPRKLREWDKAHIVPEFGEGYVLGSLEDELARAQQELRKARWDSAKVRVMVSKNHLLSQAGVEMLFDRRPLR